MNIKTKMIKKIHRKLKEHKEHLKKHENRGQKWFLIRVAIFLTLYIAISFSFGTVKDLLNQSIITVNDGYYTFFIYFLILGFIYLRRDKLKNVFAYKNKLSQTVIFSLIAALFFYLPYEFLTYNFRIAPVISYFFLYGLGQFFLFLAVFNIPFVKHQFYEELMIIALISIGYLAVPIYVEQYWTYFFIPIKYGVASIMKLLNTPYQISDVENGFIVEFTNFRGIVGPPCSGIYSMTAFTFLYATSLSLMKKKHKINKTKATFAYLSGIVTLYILNIIRILVILHVGEYYSRELAMDLFHEYLSSIFLLGIFSIYLYFIIPKVCQKKVSVKSEK